VTKSYAPYLWPGPSCNGGSSKWDLYPSRHKAVTLTS
jgi:hypothetical protein